MAMGATRMIAAGLLLLLFAKLTGKNIRLSRPELIFTAVTGLIFWTISNGLVMWAEQTANSGFTALMLASSPIWAALADALLNRQFPSVKLTGSLILGFIGLAILMLPSLLHGSNTGIISTLALFLAAIAWSLGTVYQNRNSFKLPVSVVSAYQHLFASIGYVLLWLLTNEPIPHPTLNAWLALGYLVVFGSTIGFTAFVQAVNLLPINIAMTYSYVNPVLALLLGWWLMHESITIWTLIGALMVILGVIGVFKSRQVTQ
jgi:drug/metabolite transporter (DMT)-like permease